MLTPSVATSAKPSYESSACPRFPSLLPVSSVGTSRTDGPGRTASSIHPSNIRPQVASQRQQPYFRGNVGGRIPSVMEVLEQQGVRKDVQVQPGAMPARVLSILS